MDIRLFLKMKIISNYGSQTAFAIACGKNDDWISKIIRGRRNPNEEEKRLIAEKLGFDHGDILFTKKGEKNLADFLLVAENENK